MQLNGKPMDDQMIEDFFMALDPTWKQKCEWHKQNVIHQKVMPYPLPENDESN